MLNINKFTLITCITFTSEIELEFYLVIIEPPILCFEESSFPGFQQGGLFFVHR